jgi:hypothetical protein
MVDQSHTHSDHPADLLREHGSPGAISAALLCQYEQENEVTFTALDNKALKALQEALHASVDAPWNRNHTHDLVEAVRALGLVE